MKFGFVWVDKEWIIVIYCNFDKCLNIIVNKCFSLYNNGKIVFDQEKKYKGSFSEIFYQWVNIKGMIVNMVEF